MNLSWLKDQYLDFAYYIIKDDLMAVQLIHDVAAKFAIDKPDVLKQPEVRDHQILIYKSIFDMGLIRVTYNSLKTSMVDYKKYSSFYLMEKLKFSLDEASYITGLLPGKIIRDIEYLKFELLENNNVGQRINNEFS